MCIAAVSFFLAKLEDIIGKNSLLEWTIKQSQQIADETLNLNQQIVRAYNAASPPTDGRGLAKYTQDKENAIRNAGRKERNQQLAKQIGKKVSPKIAMPQAEPDELAPNEAIPDEPTNVGSNDLDNVQPNQDNDVPQSIEPMADDDQPGNSSKEQSESSIVKKRKELIKNVCESLASSGESFSGYQIQEAISGTPGIEGVTTLMKYLQRLIDDGYLECVYTEKQRKVHISNSYRLCAPYNNE